MVRNMKSRYLLIVFSLMLLSGKVCAQHSFQASLKVRSDSFSTQVVTLDDGSFVTQQVVNDYGKTYSILITKFNNCLQPLWARRITAKTFVDNVYGYFRGVYATSFIKTHDKGFLVTYSNFTDRHVCMVSKLDSSGNLLWTKKVNCGKVNSHIVRVSCADVKDGYIVAGGADSVYYKRYYNPAYYETTFVLKLDEQGKTLWSHTMDEFPVEKVTPYIDGGFILNAEGRAMRCSPSGKVLWQKKIDARNTVVDSLGNIYMARDYVLMSNVWNGWYGSFVAPRIFKMDRNGNLVWDYYYTYPDSSHSYIYAFGLNKAGNLVLQYRHGKNLQLYRDISHIYLSEIDTSGNVLQGRMYLNTVNYDYGYSGYNNNNGRTWYGGVMYTDGNWLDKNAEINLCPDGGMMFYSLTQDGYDHLIKTDSSYRSCNSTDTVFIKNVPVRIELFSTGIPALLPGYTVNNSKVPFSSFDNDMRFDCSDRFIPHPDLGKDTVLCSESSYALSSANDNSPGSFLWSTGDTARTITVTRSGRYWLSISYGFCVSTDTITVVFFRKLKQFKDRSLNVCTHDSVLLNAPDTGLSFVWVTPTKKTIKANGLWAKDTGMYHVQLPSEGKCRFTDSVHLGWYPMPTAIAGPDTLLCYNQEYTMQGKGGVSYKWIPAKYLSNDTLPDAVVILPDSQLYKLVVRNAQGCTDTSMVHLKVRPRLRVRVYGDNNVTCSGGSISLQAAPFGGYEPNYTYYWPYDKVKSSALNIKPTRSGWHKVILQDNCSPPATDSMYIHVPIPPSANFYMRPDSLVSSGTEVTFYNQSAYSSRYLWSFGSKGSSSTATSPMHMFQDTGRYLVRLVASNDNGCSDTISKYIRVLDNFQVYIPNAFSPNGDGLNDDFRIEGTAIKEFSFTIYNRWGERVFLSTPEAPYWNGRMENRGDKVPIGLYLYQLKATDMQNEPHYYSGMVELLR